MPSSMSVALLTGETCSHLLTALDHFSLWITTLGREIGSSICYSQTAQTLHHTETCCWTSAHAVLLWVHSALGKGSISYELIFAFLLELFVMVGIFKRHIPRVLAFNLLAKLQNLASVILVGTCQSVLKIWAEVDLSALLIEFLGLYVYHI